MATFHNIDSAISGREVSADPVPLRNVGFERIRVVDYSVSETVRMVYDKVVVPEEERLVPLEAYQIELLLGFAYAGKVADVLEVGLGWGVSAAAIQTLPSLKSHVILELQANARTKLGLDNLRAVAGPTPKCKVIIEDSKLALPHIARAGRQFDLILIDGGHRFDDVFVDVTYARKLIRPGGLIFLDDTWMPSVRSVTSWMNNNLANELEEVKLPPSSNFALYRSTGQGDNRDWDHFQAFDGDPPTEDL
jgi:predicted O-methyltransferase YrrM